MIPGDAMSGKRVLDRIIDLRMRMFGDNAVPGELLTEPVDDGGGTNSVRLVRFKASP